MLMRRLLYRIVRWWAPVIVVGALVYWALEGSVHSH